MYEGEYLNGEKNGKGKEYNKDHLIYEGQYLKGKKWNGKIYSKSNQNLYIIENGKGYIIEYDELFGKLIYEREYSNGERNGKGKEFWENDEVSFEGEYLNGKRNGKGIEYSYGG